MCVQKCPHAERVPLQPRRPRRPPAGPHTTAVVRMLCNRSAIFSLRVGESRCWTVDRSFALWARRNSLSSAATPVPNRSASWLSGISGRLRRVVTGVVHGAQRRPLAPHRHRRCGGEAQPPGPVGTPPARAGCRPSLRLAMHASASNYGLDALRDGWPLDAGARACSLRFVWGTATASLKGHGPRRSSAERFPGRLGRA